VVARATLATLLCFCAACAAAPSPPNPPSRRAPLKPFVYAPPAPELVPVDKCGDTADGFDDWIASFRQRAIADGIAPAVVAHALRNVTYDDEVIELDRRRGR